MKSVCYSWNPFCFSDIQFSYIDEHKNEFIETLSEAVAIKSVSAWPDCRPEILRMVKWTAERLEKLGASTELKDLGKQVVIIIVLIRRRSLYSFKNSHPDPA